MNVFRIIVIGCSLFFGASINAQERIITVSGSKGYNLFYKTNDLSELRYTGSYGDDVTEARDSKIFSVKKMILDNTIESSCDPPGSNPKQYAIVIGYSKILSENTFQFSYERYVRVLSFDKKNHTNKVLELILGGGGLFGEYSGEQLGGRLGISLHTRSFLYNNIYDGYNLYVDVLKGVKGNKSRVRFGTEYGIKLGGYFSRPFLYLNLGLDKSFEPDKRRRLKLFVGVKVKYSFDRTDY